MLTSNASPPSTSFSCLCGFNGAFSKTVCWIMTPRDSRLSRSVNLAYLLDLAGNDSLVGAAIIMIMMINDTTNVKVRQKEHT